MLLVDVREVYRVVWVLFLQIAYVRVKKVKIVIFLFLFVESKCNLFLQLSQHDIVLLGFIGLGISGIPFNKHC
jgi:hypothetical protein